MVNFFKNCFCPQRDTNQSTHNSGNALVSPPLSPVIIVQRPTNPIATRPARPARSVPIPIPQKTSKQEPQVYFRPHHPRDARKQARFEQSFQQIDR